jgi:phosphonate transport system permease protein
VSAAGVESAPSRQRRPARPRRSPWAYVSVIAFLALTWWAGSDRFGIGFSVPELIENATRAGGIVSDFLDPQWIYWTALIGPFIETFQMAVIGGVIGCSIALVVAFLASKVTTPNTAAYLADKALLNILRALPDILYALVFVAAVGIGPLAGIIALILFNIGVVAKLLSETVDGVDLGPSEAAQAAGGNRFQQIRAAVFPQVLPNYLAFSLYTFELNLRASTVLGIVGAGGIGTLINVERAAFRYDRIAVIIVAIFVIVFVVESISIALRRRLV